MTRFKLDENLPREATELLRDARHDAVSVMDQEMSGQSDDTVAAVCRREGRALVTLDLDFADIRAYPPGDYVGIVVLRLARLDRERVLTVLSRLAPLFDTEPLTGRLWIVDESSIRVRE